MGLITRVLDTLGHFSAWVAVCIFLFSAVVSMIRGNQIAGLNIFHMYGILCLNTALLIIMIIKWKVIRIGISRSD